MNEVVRNRKYLRGGEPFRLEVSDKMLLDELLLAEALSAPSFQERSDARKASCEADRLGEADEELEERGVFARACEDCRNHCQPRLIRPRRNSH